MNKIVLKTFISLGIRSSDFWSTT